MKSRIDKTKYTFEKYSSGNKYWLKNGKYHREKDKPAIIYNTGTMYWFKNGNFHRDCDKPAKIYNTGTMTWYIDGEFIKESRKFRV